MSTIRGEVQPAEVFPGESFMKTFKDRVYRTQALAEDDLPNYADYSRTHYTWEVMVPADGTLWVIETDDFWAINNAAKVMGFEATDLGNDRYRVTVPGGEVVEVQIPGGDRVKKLAKPIVQVAKTRGYAATRLRSAKNQPLSSTRAPQASSAAAPSAPTPAPEPPTAPASDRVTRLQTIKLVFEIVAVAVAVIAGIVGLILRSK
jgi:hypothetical protein